MLARLLELNTQRAAEEARSGRAAMAGRRETERPSATTAARRAGATAATHQSCLAHLLRRCRLLRADHAHSRVVTDIQTDLQYALELRARRRAGTLSDADLDALVGRLAWRVTHPGPLADVRRFAKHLTTEWTALFTFLYDPQAIDATNWRAEHAILSRADQN